jgi:hypothetical protein
MELVWQGSSSSGSSSSSAAETRLLLLQAPNGAYTLPLDSWQVYDTATRVLLPDAALLMDAAGSSGDGRGAHAAGAGGSSSDGGGSSSGRDAQPPASPASRIAAFVAEFTATAHALAGVVPGDTSCGQRDVSDVMMYMGADFAYTDAGAWYR